MLEQSDAVKQAWQASDRTLDIVINVDGTDYQATSINSLSYDAGAFTGDSLGIGSTYENSISVEFASVIEAFAAGQVVKPQIGIKVNGAFEYTPLGVFIISEVNRDRNNNLTTIKALDQMVKLERAYTSTLTYPAAMLDVVAEIASQGGVTVNQTDLAHLPNLPKLNSAITGQTLRTAIGWIAQFYAGFAAFDRSGELTIRTTATPDYVINPSEYMQGGLTKNEVTYQTGGIKVSVTTTSATETGEQEDKTTTLQAGETSGSQIELTNNVMTNDALSTIWTSIKDVSFYPYSLNWFGNPALEAGDWVTLTDTQGNKFNVPVNQLTFTFNGGLESTISANQASQSSTVIPWTGPTQNAINQAITRKTATGNNVYDPSFTEEPKNAKIGDVWFKQNGNNVELWTYSRDSSDNASWQKQEVDGEVKAQVDEAKKLAIEAQTTADGKNSVYRGSDPNTVPTAGLKEGDLYFTNNTVYTWTGSAWEKTVSDTTGAEISARVDEAKKLATSAQATADGKNKIYRGVSIEDTPKSGAIVGDLFFSSNDLYRFDGTNWEQVVSDTTGTEIKSQVDQVSQESQKAVADLTSNVESKAKELDASIQSTKTDLTAATNAVASDLSTTKSNLDAVSKDLSTTKSNMQSGLDSVNNDLSETKSDLATVSKDLSDTKSSTQSSLDAINKDLSTTKSNLGTVSNDLSETKSNLATVTDDLSKTKSSMQSGLDAVNKDLSTTKSDLATVSKDLTATKSNLDTVSGDLSETKSNLATVSNDLSETKNNLADTGQKLATAVSNFQKTTDQLSGSLETANSKIEFNSNAISEVKHTAEEISTTVSDHTGKISQLQQTTNGLTSTVSGMNVGGRNLLDGETGKEHSATGTTSYQDVANFGMLVPADQEHYVLSFDAKSTTAGQQISTFLFCGSDYSKNCTVSAITSSGYNGPVEGDGRVTTALTTDYKRYWIKYTINPANKVYLNAIIARIEANSGTATVSVKNAKLETGTMPTDWTPSPESINSSISQIKQTADNIQTQVNDSKGDISQLQQDAKGLTSRVGSAEGNISQLQQTADKIQAQVDDNKGNISSVTQTANAVKTDLANTKGDVSSLQQTANKLTSDMADAEGNISSLQQTATGLQSTVQSQSGKISQLQQEADGLSATVANGGQNLILNSGNPSTLDHWWWTGEVTLHKHLFWKNGTENLFVLSNTSSTNEKIFCSERFAIEPNQDYTLSFYAFSNSALRDADVYYLPRKSGSSNNFDTAVILAPTVKFSISHAQYISLTFNSGNYNEGYIRFDNNSSTTEGTSADLYLTDIQLEKGKIATAWSNSPSDIAQLKITADGLTSKIADTQGDVSTLQQTTNGLSTTVSNIRVGGRNLLRNSINFPYSANNSNSWTTGLWRIAGQTTDDNMKRVNKEIADSPCGKANAISFTGILPSSINDISLVAINSIPLSGKVTVSFWARQTNNVDTAFVSAGWSSMPMIATNASTAVWGTTQYRKLALPKDGSWTRFWATFNVSSGQNVYVGCGNTGASAEVQICLVKIESGTMATDWTPAPEDTDQAISKVSQTAEEIRADLTNTQGDVASVQATASSLQTQITDNKNNISSVKQTADSLITRMSNAEGNVSSLQQTAKGLETTVGQMPTQWQQAINDKTNAQVLSSGVDMNTLTTAGTYLVKDSNVNNAPLGAWFMATVEATADGARVVQRVKKDTANIAYERSNTDMGWTAWERVATGSDISSIQQTINGITTRVGSAEGNISTLQQTAKDITSRVGSAEGNISQLQQTANGLTSTISGMNVGGRNLLNGETGKEYSATGTTSYQDVANFGMLVPADQEHYVLSFDAKSTTAGQQISTFLFCGSDYSKNCTVSAITSSGYNGPVEGDGRVTTALTTDYKRYWIKYTINPANKVYLNAIIARIEANNGTATVSVKNAKLETGTMPTDWTPSPESIDSSISQIKQNTDGITAYVKASKGSDTLASLLSMDPNNSTIAQVVNGKPIAAINLSSEGDVTIDGKKLHITASTTIDDASIGSAKIASLSADKITAGTLDASVVTVKNINADNITAGTLAAEHLHVTKDTVIDSGVIGNAQISNLSADKITAGTLDASQIRVINLDANSITTGSLSAAVIKASGFNNYTVSPSNTFDFDNVKSTYGNWFLIGETTADHVYNGPKDANNKALTPLMYVTSRGNPDGNRFTVTVWKDDDPTQYQRIWTGDHWTDWVILPNSQNIISAINISPDSVMISGKKIMLDGDVTIDGTAFASKLKATGITVDKLVAGIIDASKINVINLNANNITAGTINGNNLSINLDNGQVAFTKGSLHSTDGMFNIDLDNKSFKIQTNNGVGLFVDDNGFHYKADSTSDLWINKDGFHSYTDDNQNGTWIKDDSLTNADAIGQGVTFQKGNIQFSSLPYWSNDSSKVYGTISRDDDLFSASKDGLRITGRDGVTISSDSCDANSLLTNTYGPLVFHAGSGLGLSDDVNRASCLYSNSTLYLSAGQRYPQDSSQPSGLDAQPTIAVGTGEYYSHSGAWMSIPSDHDNRGNSVSVHAANFNVTARDWINFEAQGSDARIAFQANYIHMYPTYLKTTSAGANVYVAADGALLRSTSARKYKTDIQPANEFADYGDKLINLTPKVWLDKAEVKRYKDDPEKNKKPGYYYGLIADELDQAGLNKLVTYGADGQVEGIQYDRLAVALLPIVKKLKEEVQELKERISK